LRSSFSLPLLIAFLLPQALFAIGLAGVLAAARGKKKRKTEKSFVAEENLFFFSSTGSGAYGTPPWRGRAVRRVVAFRLCIGPKIQKSVP
jgi:hypothetical protein